ncbi:MAG: LPS export ABC transporter periplasmic protein LptC [Gammaproteobacteria bacterium]|nr:LPS export ABC transporter periplasmic protein LptC [Gammaproteobacteria bacterium]
MTRWQLLGVLVAAGLLAFLLLDRSEIDTPQALPPELADEPDLYMEGATITQFNDDGSVRYRLASKEIRHFERDDTTRLREPVLTIHRAPEPPWWVSANHGYIRYREAAAKDNTQKNEEVVFLRESVVLEQRLEARHIRLTTESLYVYPERQFAETDQAVMIDTNAGRTRAVGLAGDLNAGLLKLSSGGDQRVHTIVLPDQFKRAPSA